MTEREVDGMSNIERIWWPGSVEPPTEPVVFWRGGIQPETAMHPRWEVEYVPAEQLRGAVERVEIVEGALLEACEAAWPRQGAEKAAEFTMREIDARRGRQ